MSCYFMFFKGKYRHTRRKMVGLIQSLQIVAKCPKDMPLLPICKIPQRIKIKNSVVEIRIRLNINAPHQAAMTALVNTRQNVSQFGSCSAIRSRGCAGGCSLAGRDGVCGLLVSGLAARRNAETACVKRLASSYSAAAAAADSCTSDAFCCVTRSISETANAT